MKYQIYTTLLVLFLLIGCAPTQPPQEPKTTQPRIETPAETIQQQPEVTPAVEAPKEEIIIPSDIKAILEKGKTALTSYSYNYKSPDIQESYKIYVKGNKIKIIPPGVVNVAAGKFYNTIYLDTEKKTAEAYCLGYSNCGNNMGKIKDLNYKDTYIETPLDWLAKVTEAKKIDERQFENRKSLYLETNIGKITVEFHYGFLYRIEDGKKLLQFTDAAFNSVADSDVIPP